MCFVGMMEGMQIALFAVVNMPEEELKNHAIAYANCELTFRDQNLQAFLIGRQICVTVCMFVVARITTLNVVVGDGNIFGVSDGLQAFFNTGLLGAIITTIVASLAWQFAGFGVAQADWSGYDSLVMYVYTASSGQKGQFYLQTGPTIATWGSGPEFDLTPNSWTRITKAISSITLPNQIGRVLSLGGTVPVADEAGAEPDH